MERSRRKDELGLLLGRRQCPKRQRPVRLLAAPKATATYAVFLLLLSAFRKVDTYFPLKWKCQPFLLAPPLFSRSSVASGRYNTVIKSAVKFDDAAAAPSDRKKFYNWSVVEEYNYRERIPENALESLMKSSESVQNYCQRLDIDASNRNLTVPIILMLLDSDRYPSLSKARKACRQGKILWKENSRDDEGDGGSDPQATFVRASVGDRVVVKPSESSLGEEEHRILIRQETQNALDHQKSQNQDTSGNGSVTTASSSSSSREYEICSLVQPPFQLEVLYEDDSMAVVNKPAGVLMYPDAGKGKNNVLFALPYVLKRPRLAALDDDDDDTILERPVPVHRLDFATSGIVVVAKMKHASSFLSQQFQRRLAKKTYTALVYGTPRVEDGYKQVGKGDTDLLKRTTIEEQKEFTNEGEWKNWNLADCFLDGKRATTRWKLTNFYDFRFETEGGECSSFSVSMIELKPITGRYHQLRRQLAFLYDTPIVGDPIYAKEFVDRTFSNAKFVKRNQRGLMLCSNEIEIAHPFHGILSGTVKTEESVSKNHQIYKDEEGISVLKVTIGVHDKFEKFLRIMRKMTAHVSPV